MTSQLNDISVVSFDLDDTLWDCASVIKHAEKTCYEWLTVNAPRIEFDRYHDTMLLHRKDALQARPELASDVTALRLLMLQKTLSEFDYPHTTASDAFDVFYTARSQVELYTGCHDLLEELNNSYTLAAITNGNADLSLIGIEHFFDAIHKADLNNPAKPDRHMFEQCLTKFDIGPSAMLHVGDNPQTDVAGAQALGIRAVWFNSQQIPWPEALPRAEFEVKSLAELQELLLFAQ